MYGETGALDQRAGVVGGLSPHVRGNHVQEPHVAITQGSIPACTGKPAPVAGRHTMSEVYPRMYGETVTSVNPHCIRSGLSPHVRGNPPRRAPKSLGARSIPACTGKPTWCAGSGSRSGVYPRMYGETLGETSVPTIAPGLSPHVRGNHEIHRPARTAARSIPACTGKPIRFAFLEHVNKVYPRMYGETSAGPKATGAAPGLSPHVRGNLRRAEGDRGRAGSIPACTGKPADVGYQRSAHEVYPRMYGETHSAHQRSL